MNTMSSFSHLTGSSTKILMLILEYYEQWADRMEDYLNRIDEDLMRSIKRGEYCQVMLLDIGIAATNEDMITRKETK